jgi:hypothetical protein
LTRIRQVPWFLLVVLAAGCTRHEAPRGLGRRVAGGEVLSLRVSPDGAQVGFLHRCHPVKDRTLPPGTAACELAVVPSGGGETRRVAGGVTTLPQGFAWGGSGHVLAALADYDHAEGRGALVLWSGGEPRRAAEGVSFYALDRTGGRVGWVSGGQLYLARVGDAAPPAAVAGAQRVATFEFGGAEGVDALARRSARAGGELLAVRGGAAVAVAADVRDYEFARGGRRFAFTWGAFQSLSVAGGDGLRSAAPLGREVRAFAFSPRGDDLAFVADAAPGKQGDLYLTASGAAPGRVARRVGELRWSADGSRLAWLQDYDPRSRTGTFVLGGPGAKPAALAKNVSDFDITADGGSAAFLIHETAGGYSVDLGLARAGGAPATIARGVFGFAFSPDSRWLYYRTACVREAEACDLLRVPASGPPPAGKPELIAQGVKSFEFAPGRPGRLLVSWARKDRLALDLAFWEGGRLTAIDTYALPGSVQFLGADATRIAYAVVELKRAGVYVAAVP